MNLTCTTEDIRDLIDNYKKAVKLQKLNGWNKKIKNIIKKIHKN